MKRHFLNAILFICLVCPLALAEEELEPGNWEKVNSLQPGEPIVIYSKAGLKLDCHYRKIDRTLLGSASFVDDRPGGTAWSDRK
jgi:hypothetical protein